MGSFSKTRQPLKTLIRRVLKGKTAPLRRSRGTSTVDQRGRVVRNSRKSQTLLTPERRSNRDRLCGGDAHPSNLRASRHAPRHRNRRRTQGRPATATPPTRSPRTSESGEDVFRWHDVGKVWCTLGRWAGRRAHRRHCRGWQYPRATQSSFAVMLPPWEMLA